MAAALLDRLLHRCHIVNIRGNSYRMRHHVELSKDLVWDRADARRITYVCGNSWEGGDSIQIWSACCGLEGEATEYERGRQGGTPCPCASGRKYKRCCFNRYLVTC